MNNVQTYTREQPSPRYEELSTLYGEMHEFDGGEQGASGQNFNGFSLIPHAEAIRNLIIQTGSQTVMDYGCGKGLQYKNVVIELPDGTKFENVVAYWGLDRVACFDPGVPEFSAMPAAAFDGVVSTDVLEHCPEEDLPWILREMAGKAEKFMFATVALYPAAKILPNGENAHCTLKSPDWWQALLEDVLASRPELSYRFELHWEHMLSAKAAAKPPVVIEKTVRAAAA
jgi:hypothetical protein